jgi:type I restriction enzyme M protein
LPNGVFNPYTGIKTNVLFFDKGSTTKEIWYYEHPYPDGVKSYNKGKPIDIKEFDTEKAWWDNRVENEHAWKVPIAEIEKRGFNLDIKNPHQEADSLGTPAELLAAYTTSQEAIVNMQDKIKAILTEALG